jgi:hypothetical protein
MVWLRRHVARFSFWNRRDAKVYLQIQDSREGQWRDANARDLAEWESEQERERLRANSNGFFPIGIRVKVNQQSGFHKGARGFVQFQEPSEGRVWVVRDGDSGPKFFWGYELDYDEHAFTAPQQATLTVQGGTARMWWIAIGELRVKGDVATQWCDENGIETRMLLAPHYDPGYSTIHLAGFDNADDASLFYLRFR